MYLRLPAPPFDREGLTDLFGFPVPPPFVALLNALCDDCRSAEAAYERVDDVLGWILAGENQRYTQTPPELFPIASTGVDGGHFGYVIHAPEREASDYPIARFEPMDGVGVRLTGASTFEAAETLLSRSILWEQQDGDLMRSPLSSEWWPAVGQRLRRLGIEPALAKAKRNYDEAGSGKPVVPAVPDGWRHVPASDGVGVLAPATQFHPTALHDLEDRPDAGSVLDAAMRYAADRLPATALWFLRQCYWHIWSVDSHGAAALYRGMIDAYHSLRRPTLAAVVHRRLLILQPATTRS
jgi:hypothetical protein